jgi:predicted CoA-substrate-specific enzyme activase
MRLLSLHRGSLNMAWFMGIDIGSGTSKGVVIKDGNLMVYHLLASGVNYKMTAQKLRDELLAKAGLLAEDIAHTITTGHGEGIIPFSHQHVADMRCCAKGINRIFPLVRTVIDVQGQSSQVIRLDERGHVVNFVINEICAGGSGYFLEVIANVLQVGIEDIGPLSLKSKNPIAFTTRCAVFGESEAISRVAEGIPKEDILAGVHKALAGKISALIDRVGLEEPCAISGGCGLNIGLIKRVEEMGVHLLVPPQPQLVNALGAAIMAEEQII